MNRNRVCSAALLCLFLPVMGLAQGPPVYTISTLAGNGTAGFSGDSGAATSAQLSSPFSVAVDKSGNVYIADQVNNRVRMVSATGTITTVAGNGTAGFSGDGGAATSATLTTPEGVAVDASGNLYISDTGNCVVRKVTSGTISTVVGAYPGDLSPCNYFGDGGPATGAGLAFPTGLAFDSKGNLYVADTLHNAIRMVSGGNISTVVGNGFGSHQGDGGPASRATVNNPQAVAVDAAGNLYIGDTGNGVIRKVDANGIITTFAGKTPGGPISGDGGPATSAQLNSPVGVAADASGNLLIADRFNSRIRMVLVNGTIVTVAGNGTPGYNGDGGPATSAALSSPIGVAVDGSGNVYVTDNQNDCIRKLTPSSTTIPAAPVIQANGVISATAFGGLKGVAPGSWIEIYGSNFSTTTRGWASADFNGINAPTSLDGTRVSVGGNAAFVAYVSPTQVNALVPTGNLGGLLPVTVTNAAGTSAPSNIQVTSTVAGLLAPSSFNVGGKQYVVALFSDGTYVAPPGSIAGVTSRQAKAGETITLYGIGFGTVTPAVPVGQIAPGTSTLTSPFQIFFGQTPAPLSYDGLAPALVGLYQFNVVVPAVAANDAVPLSFNLNSSVGTQTLYTAVQ